MFKWFKKVHEELKAYKKRYKQPFFTRRRIWITFLDIFKRTRFSLLLIVIALFLYFRPIPFSPDSFFIPFTQVIAIFFLSWFILNVLVGVYHHLSLEYFRTFEKSYDEFNRILKIILSFLFFIIIAILFSIQLFYIRFYVNTELEGCSYYDWYGNKIYQSKEIGECQELVDLESKKHQSIQFGVINQNETGYIYEQYHYQYVDFQFIKRDIITYSITEDQINGTISLKDTDKIEQFSIENTYGETEFISTQTHQQFKTGITEVTIIKSQLEEDGTITATKEVDGELVETTTLHGTEYSIKHDNYTVSKWSNQTISETYFNHISYSTKREQKTILYRENRKTEFFNPVITDMITLGSHHRFEVEYNTIETRIKILHHYVDGELLYNSVFDYTDYGYKVDHYAYYRDNLGMIQPADKRTYLTYCYLTDDMINNNDFDYFFMTSKKFNLDCSSPIFYNDNPLYLNYNKRNF